MKIRVIDLLNKIANGEEVPIFRYEGYNYKYDENLDMFVDLDNELRCKTVMHCCELNDKVEIIEDTPKISKLYINNKLQYDLSPKEDKKIKKMPYYDYKKITSENNRDKFIEKLLEKHDKRLNDYHEKINEIISYLNKEE